MVCGSSTLPVNYSAVVLQLKPTDLQLLQPKFHLVTPTLFDIVPDPCQMWSDWAWNNIIYTELKHTALLSILPIDKTSTTTRFGYIRTVKILFDRFEHANNVAL